VTAPEFGLLIATATESAKAALGRGDYRRKFLHLGVGGIHVVAARSVSLDRLASVLEQPTKEQP